MAIRRIELSDVPRAAEIHVFGWRCAYQGIVPDDYLFNNMRVSQRMLYFESAVRDNVTESYVYDDGIVKALLTIGPCRDGDKKGAFELWGIYVEPLMKRQGIGAAMAEFCEQQARARSYREICLWVLKQNQHAKAFYEKMGYQPDGTIKHLDFLSLEEARYVKKLH